MDEEPLIQTDTEGMHCPACDYDLRGTTEAVCPECGTPFTPAGIAARARYRWRFERIFLQLLIIPCVWFALYFLLGKIFSGALDRINVLWVKLVFLNMPLQLLLTALAYGCLKADNATVKRCGGIVTIVVLILVATHTAISLVTN